MVLPTSLDLRSQLLKLLNDQNIHSLPEVKEALIKKFDLTADDKRKVMKNQRPVFDTRIIHSLSQLRKNGLITNQRKAEFRITRLGLNELKRL
jgi:restriction endonuclease Mrr